MRVHVAIFTASIIVGLCAFAACVTMLLGTRLTDQQTGVVFGMALASIVLMIVGALAREESK